ncbi:MULTISPECIES: Fur family transcriptional regulator [Rhodomicrobium]|uniref:Fur family transcriptional regulator n=1 Tax=Rhodomicrobium TaxID=1068 RepID=UPI000B4B56BE|nr:MULTISPECIES: Fur family transcriptional regulator [Rhodomicrobium]
MPDNLFPRPEHDHGSCIEHAIGRAHEICAEKSVRLTALRESVLRVLLSSHKALGAYEIIERLQTDGRRLAPISVYRIIDVLLSAGLAHRLESKNAFFACLSEHDSANSMLVLVCDGCYRVAEAEAPDAWGAIKSVTQSSGFAVTETILEIQGTCADCRKTTRPAA